MTLDEAIEHALEKSIEGDCPACCDEHYQLYLWLSDYRELLKERHENEKTNS